LFINIELRTNRAISLIIFERNPKGDVKQTGTKIYDFRPKSPLILEKLRDGYYGQLVCEVIEVADRSMAIGPDDLPVTLKGETRGPFFSTDPLMYARTV